MTDFADFDNESQSDRAARRRRAHVITSGARGSDGLTDGERELHERLRRLGLEIINKPPFARYITKRNL